MPEFPTIDLSSYIQWFQTGIVKMISANAPIAIGAALAIAGLILGIRKITSFGKSAMRG